VPGPSTSPLDLMSQPSNAPTLSDLIAFVREWFRIPDGVPIDAQTRLDADLGITGADGADLLRDVATHYQVALCDEASGYRDAFELSADEHLFHSEGGGSLFGIGPLIGWILRGFREIPPAVVVDLSLGRLHSVLLRQWRDGDHAV
jgi:hypothetical protein